MEAEMKSTDLVMRESVARRLETALARAEVDDDLATALQAALRLIREPDLTGVFIGRVPNWDKETRTVFNLDSFQGRATNWSWTAFEGHAPWRDMEQRCDRFVEEVAELTQSLDYPRARAHMLIDYAYDRPKGEPHQEVGGVGVTLAVLCSVAEINLAHAWDIELARCWNKIDAIRAKQSDKAARLPGSPLPGASA